MSAEVAILGTGTMGSALARALARGGVTLAIGSRDPAHAADFAAKLERERGVATVGGDHAAAVREADLVVLALDYAHVRHVVATLGASLEGKVLVDPTTPWGEDVGATSAAEEIARVAPSGASIVGAWKTTFAAELDAARAGEPHDALVCGDDANAKRRVEVLVRAAGFRALDAGSLSQARVIEGMCRMMVPILRATGATAGAVPAWRFVP